MPNFSSKNIDEIKSKLSIVDVMSDYAVIEDKSGKKWVRCPFHSNGNERTPSCMLDEERGTYYCFACKEHGDIFTLVGKKEGFDFPGTVEYLARKAGIQLIESSEFEKREKGEKEKLYELYDKLAHTLNYLLKSSDEASYAREYLNRRNITSETVENFLLGYAPKDSKWLFSFLLKKGYNHKLLNSSGLFSKNYPELSLFKDRLMFPIRDRFGRVIAFSGRDLSNSTNVGKYINSPETLIYSKKENFFGLFEAKKTIASGINPIICEGNFDVITLHQCGLNSAIASLGTAFTQEQCQNLKKWFSSLKAIDLLFDNDEAGITETLKAIVLVNSNSLDVNTHKLLSGKDPSEIIEKFGKNKVIEEFKETETGFQYLVNYYLNRYDIRTAKGKSDFVGSLSAFLISTESQVEKEAYISEISKVLKVSEESVVRDLESRRIKENKVFKPNNDDNLSLNKNKQRPTIDKIAMFYLACHTELFPKIRTTLKVSDLSSHGAQEIYVALEQALRLETLGNDTLLLSYIAERNTREELSEVLFSLSGEYRNQMSEEAFWEAIDRLKLKKLEQMRSVVTEQIAINQEQVGTEVFNDLIARKMDIDKDILELKRKLKGV